MASLAFVAGGERRSLPAEEVEEVLPMAALSADGHLLLRGHRLPVRAPGGKLPGPGGYILIVRAGGLREGLAVDDVIGVETEAP